MGLESYLIVGAVCGLIGMLLASFKRKIGASIDRLVEKFLDYFNFRVALYKKKSRDIYSLIVNEICVDPYQRTKVPKFTFEEFDKHKNIPITWEIIKIDKELDAARIVDSLILQIPGSSLYSIERNLMDVQHKRAFFYAISKRVAIKLNKPEVIDVIETKVEKLGDVGQYQLFNEIIANNDKFTAMIQEARRKWRLEEGNIGKTAKQEFCQFVDNLGKSKVGVVCIEWFYSKKQASNYLHDVRICLRSYRIVHIYARGNSLKSRNLAIIQELYDEIKKKINHISIRDEGIYDWFDAKGNILYKARTIIIEKN